MSEGVGFGHEAPSATNFIGVPSHPGSLEVRILPRIVMRSLVAAEPRAPVPQEPPNPLRKSSVAPPSATAARSWSIGCRSVAEGQAWRAPAPLRGVDLSFVMDFQASNRPFRAGRCGSEAA